MKKNTVLVISALVISVIIGLSLDGRPEVANLFEPLGTIYLNFVKLLMAPLVLSSLILGISNASDIKNVGKMGIATLLVFLVTTSFAVIIGLIFSNLFTPGIGVEMPADSYEITEMPGFSSVIMNAIPSNIIYPILENNMLQIIVISVLVGAALLKVKNSIYLKKAVTELHELTNIVLDWVMKLTPIGILGLMIPTVARNGVSVIMPLIKVILVFYFAVLIHIVLVYVPLLLMFTDMSVKGFFKDFFPAMVLAFTSCSSIATLPVSIKQLQQKMGISKGVSGFVLSLGSTINMDGNALYQGIISLFIAQVYGIELPIGMQILIILTGTIASIGAAGVPGAGMIVLGTVLMSVGLPIDGIVVVAGIDRILDMGRTMINVTGDAVTALIVEKQVSKK